jgi:hypothetical protein
MQKRLENPHSALLAYRWYWATFEDIMDRREHFRRPENESDMQYTKWRYKGNQLNHEIFACYDITIFEPAEPAEEDDNPTRRIRIDFIVQLFKNSRIQRTIRLWDDRGSFEETPENVRSQITDFCSTEFLVCTCDNRGVKRLGNRCMDCFVYHYRRVDNDCCPICLENEGRWIQLSCSHILHTFCWQRMPGNKCPVCRAVIDVHAVHHNYPFNTVAWPSANEQWDWQQDGDDA